MKYIVIICSSFILVGCSPFKVTDKRCRAIKKEAWKIADKEIEEKGSCEEVLTSKRHADGTPIVACKVIVEASKKCMELPYDPKYVTVTDPGVKLDEKGNPISMDGKLFRIKQPPKTKPPQPKKRVIKKR